MDIWVKPPIKKHWLECPNCHYPKMIMYRDDTILVQYPAWCKKCKTENLITLGVTNRALSQT